MKVKLVLEDGHIFNGDSLGSVETRIGELIFNTSMVGYQEIISDPSYCDQFVCMTYPLIGNYGINSNDFESDNIYLSALIINKYTKDYSNFRANKSLEEILIENNVVGICNIDTRKLTKVIRQYGSMRAMICLDTKPTEDCLKELKNYCYPINQVSRVSIKESYTINSRLTDTYHIGILDCGCKTSIINCLMDYKLTIYPYNTSATKLLSDNLDGLIISNGPGDPRNIPEVVEVLRELKGKIPMLGICLGHQLLGLSYGLKITKMKFGHRGANQTVLDLDTDKLYITSQNHSFELMGENLSQIENQINLKDCGCEGIRDYDNFITGVQYHPEASPGPWDAKYVFNQFINDINRWKGKS